MTWLTFVLASFATYRISRIVVLEDGPGDVFSRFRHWIGQGSSFGRGLHCFWCTSVWIAGLVAVYLTVTHKVIWSDFPLVWFGIAGGAVVMYQVVR